MAKRTFLFDLDGTLWDSHRWYAAALHTESGLTRDEAVERLRAGHNVVAMARDMKLTNASFARRCYKEVAELQLYDGVPEVLSQLAAQGNDLGVVTNLPGWLVEPTLRDLGINQHFKTWVFAAKKPSGKGILRALEELGRPANSSTFYVGDMPTDATAAQRAGVSFAWASYGYAPACPAIPHVVLHRFAEVLSL